MLGLTPTLDRQVCGSWDSGSGMKADHEHTGIIQEPPLSKSLGVDTLITKPGSESDKE